MDLRPIHLLIPPRIIAEFKKQAKSAFPKETFAYLLGRDAGTIVEVEELFVPSDVEEGCTERSVNGTMEWVLEAIREAESQELSIVGDIHSHPYRMCEPCADAAPSMGDLDAGHTQIHGICVVRQLSNKKLTTSIRFWGPQIKVIEERI